MAVFFLLAYHPDFKETKFTELRGHCEVKECKDI